MYLCCLLLFLLVIFAPFSLRTLLKVKWVSLFVFVALMFPAHTATADTEEATQWVQCSQNLSIEQEKYTGTNTETGAYQCAEGYYGKPQSCTDSSACKQCPTADYYTDADNKAQARGKSPAGTETRNGCYMDGGQGQKTYYSKNGSFVIVDKPSDNTKCYINTI